ncbi:MAG TPA: diguanylate cyclase, partial [Tepiditoga sp.]|nr:diguanylate cyclase [Tepiditoga sp.]
MIYKTLLLTSGSSAAGYIRNFDIFGEIKVFNNSEVFFEFVLNNNPDFIILDSDNYGNYTEKFFEISEKKGIPYFLFSDSNISDNSFLISSMYSLERNIEKIKFTEEIFRLKNQLRKYKYYSKIFFDNSYQGIMITDSDYNILKVNSGFKKMFSFNSDGKISCFDTKELREFIFEIIPIDFDDFKSHEKVINKNGKYYYVFYSVFNCEGNKTIVFNVVDITDKKELQKSSDYYLNYDPVTNSPNRFYLKITVDRYIENKKPFAMIYADIDNFKYINEKHSHFFGDEVLKMFYERMKLNIENIEFISRIGGDEFVIITESKNAEKVTELLYEMLINPFEIDDEKIYMKLSCGISYYPENGNNFSDLMKCSDKALYNAKTLGKNTYVFYTKEVFDYTYEKIKNINILNNAVKNGDFEVYFQPIFYTEGENVYVKHFEALVRFISEGKIIGPFSVIKTAEEIGIITELTLKIIDRIFSMNTYFSGYTVTINISPKDLEFFNIDGEIKKISEKYNIKCSDYVFEITESCELNYNENIHIINKLKKLG